MKPLAKNADTIAACATPTGEGGIAVLRVSGPRAFAITDIYFRCSIPAAHAAAHTLHVGTIVHNETVIDTVVVSIFHRPHSYTGEDVAEISCHGGYYIAHRILSLLLEGGARMASPGEFTLRAFLNGKIDLSQAEAVNDLIHAKTEKAHIAGIQQLEGKLSRFVHTLRQELLNICSLFELELDFSEDDITLTDRNAAAESITKILATVNKAIDSYAGGKLVKEGVRIVLAGKPNAGKSSLLNILLDQNRAIVSQIPGTTRDSIEENVSIGGLLFTFIDTAGLRNTVNEIEQEGVRRTQNHISTADAVIILIDASMPIEPEDTKLYNNIEEIVSTHAIVFYVLNKSDKPILISNEIARAIGKRHCSISCKTHDGIEALKNMLFTAMLPAYDTDSISVTLTNVRHKQSFNHAADSLSRAYNTVVSGMSGEFVAVDLRDALDHLGNIIGITTPEDILNNIFSNFCIGK